MSSQHNDTLEKTKVLILGDIIVDFYLQMNPGPSLSLSVGGGPAVTAIALARVDILPVLNSILGDDFLGKVARNLLEEAKVNVSHVRMEKNAMTPFFFANCDANYLDLTAINSQKTLSPDLLFKCKIDPENVTEFFALHTCSSTLRIRNYREFLSSYLQPFLNKNILISFDINLRLETWQSPELARERILNSIGYFHLVKCTCEELFFLTECSELIDSATQILNLGPHVLCVTDGKRGCHLFTHNLNQHLPAFKITCSDSLGAGDAAMAAILVKLSEFITGPNELHNLDREQIIQVTTWANAAGAITASRQGASIAAPYKEEIEKLISSQRT